MKVLSLPSNLNKFYEHWEILQVVEKQFQKKNWLRCIAHCNELIESVENDFFGYYYRGLCNVKLKLLKEAIQDLKLSRTNLRKNSFPRLMIEYEQDVELRIANIFRLERNYGSALAKLDELLEKYPKYVNGYKEKAGIYTDMNDLNSALDSVNQGLKHNSNDKELQMFKKFLIYDLTTNKKE